MSEHEVRDVHFMKDALCILVTLSCVLRWPSMIAGIVGERVPRVDLTYFGLVGVFPAVSEKKNSKSLIMKMSLLDQSHVPEGARRGCWLVLHSKFWTDSAFFDARYRKVMHQLNHHIWSSTLSRFGQKKSICRARKASTALFRPKRAHFDPKQDVRNFAQNPGSICKSWFYNAKSRTQCSKFLAGKSRTINYPVG